MDEMVFSEVRVYKPLKGIRKIDKQVSTYRENLMVEFSKNVIDDFTLLKSDSSIVQFVNCTWFKFMYLKVTFLKRVSMYCVFSIVLLKITPVKFFFST